MNGGITFDAGGLIALDRNDRRVLTLLARAKGTRHENHRSSNRSGQAMRNPARQSRLSRLIRQADTDLIPLDGRDATAVGMLLASCQTADIADAHVVVCAPRARQPIATSDAEDLRRIAAGLTLVAI